MATPAGDAATSAALTELSERQRERPAPVWQVDDGKTCLTQRGQMLWRIGPRTVIERRLRALVGMNRKRGDVLGASVEFE